MGPYRYADKISINATAETKKDAKSKVGSTRSVLTNWGNGIGKYHGERFTGYKYKTDRYFYVSEAKDFKKAFKLLKDNEPNQAFQIVEKLTKSDSKPIRDKAWFNLAVIAEALGKLDDALEYVGKSEALLANTYKLRLKSASGKY